MIYMIESQLNYIADYLATLDRTGAAALDTRAGAQQAWCDDIERRMASTVWTTGGCVSWYLNAAGRNPTLWPGSTIGRIRAHPATVGDGALAGRSPTARGHRRVSAARCR